MTHVWAFSSHGHGSDIQTGHHFSATGPEAQDDSPINANNEPLWWQEHLVSASEAQLKVSSASTTHVKLEFTQQAAPLNNMQGQTS